MATAESSTGMRASLSTATDTLVGLVRPYLDSPPAEDERVDLAQRRAIINAANKLLRTVQEPADEMLDMTAQLGAITATRLFCEWGVFEAIPLQGGASYASLASTTDTEEILLRRISGILIAFGILELNEKQELVHTKRSRVFTNDQDQAGLLFHISWDNVFYPYAQFPAYFAKYGRREPQTLNHVPITFAYGSPEDAFYDQLARDPPRMQRFIKGMKGLEEQMPIAGIYDFGWLVAEVLAHPAADRPIFVDVGGGSGHAIKAIQAEFPDLPLPRFILQDRAEVLEASTILQGGPMASIQRVPIDFHKEQPIKGAHIYWIRRCLHNYSDTISINIMRIIAEAMASDSRLLIEEDVMENPPYHIAAMMDIMMLGYGGKQRTIELWEKIAAEAGLRISSVSRGSGPWKTMCVIECMKV
ncbi:O-methyltransferase [Thozetella sp. PMI_491]|nr:O-methyltransferase [Thozetella sp. PMI_491]